MFPYPLMRFISGRPARSPACARYGAPWLDARSHALETGRRQVVEIGRYSVSVDVEHASPAVECGTYVVLHRQAADGSWKRALDVFDPDEPTAARHDIEKEERSNEEGS